MAIKKLAAIAANVTGGIENAAKIHVAGLLAAAVISAKGELDPEGAAEIYWKIYAKVAG